MIPPIHVVLHTVLLCRKTNPVVGHVRSSFCHEIYPTTELLHLGNQSHASSFWALSTQLCPHRCPPCFPNVMSYIVSYGSMLCDPTRAGQQESCGKCGDTGCFYRPGGESGCCMTVIRAAGKSCDEGFEAPCIMPFSYSSASATAFIIPIASGSASGSGMKVESGFASASVYTTTHGKL